MSKDTTTNHSDSSKDRDDTYGHFEGEPGTIIAKRYRLVRDVGMGTFGRVVEAIDMHVRQHQHQQQRQYQQHQQHQQGDSDHHGRGGIRNNGYCEDGKAPYHHNYNYHQHNHNYNHHQHHQRPRYYSNKTSSSSQQQHSSSNNKNNVVAIKIVRNVKRYHESALIEADIVKDVNKRGGGSNGGDERGQSLCAIMLNRFDFQGHCCLVFECLGRSLYDFLKEYDYRPFPLYCVKAFAHQLLDALDFIHGFGLIHTDLKPENILLLNNNESIYRSWDGTSTTEQVVPASTRIKVIDFGGAVYDHEKKSSVVNTRQYRAPEVILGLGWSTPSDLWSAG